MTSVDRPHSGSSKPRRQLPALGGIVLHAAKLSLTAPIFAACGMSAPIEWRNDCNSAPFIIYSVRWISADSENSPAAEPRSGQSASRPPRAATGQPQRRKRPRKRATRPHDSTSPTPEPKSMLCVPGAYWSSSPGSNECAQRLTDVIRRNNMKAASYHWANHERRLRRAL